MLTARFNTSLLPAPAVELPRPKQLCGGLYRTALVVLYLPSATLHDELGTISYQVVPATQRSARRRLAIELSGL